MMDLKEVIQDYTKTQGLYVLRVNNVTLTYGKVLAA